MTRASNLHFCVPFQQKSHPKKSILMCKAEWMMISRKLYSRLSKVWSTGHDLIQACIVKRLSHWLLHPETLFSDAWKRQSELRIVVTWSMTCAPLSMSNGTVEVQGEVRSMKRQSGSSQPIGDRNLMDAWWREPAYPRLELLTIREQSLCHRPYEDIACLITSAWPSRQYLTPIGISKNDAGTTSPVVAS